MIKQSAKRILPYLVVFLIPIISYAQEDKGLVPGCGDKDQPDCNFGYFFSFIQDIVNFVIFNLAIPIAIIMIIYAGWLYLVDMGKESRKSQAKRILSAVAIGLVIMLGSWLIIDFIFDVFVEPDFREAKELLK